MHSDQAGLLPEAIELGPLPLTVSGAANDRYWAGAGVEHPARRAGWLYPPMAANLTVLLVQTRLADPLLHTAQRLDCHRGGRAPADLVVEGVVTRRFVKRDREYMVVEAVVSVVGEEPLWTSVATFTPVAS
jgi:hypothetical protein